MPGHRGHVGTERIEIDRDGTVGRHHLKNAREPGPFHGGGEGQDRLIRVWVNGLPEFNGQGGLTQWHDARSSFHLITGAQELLVWYRQRELPDLIQWADIWRKYCAVIWV